MSTFEALNIKFVSSFAHIYQYFYCLSTPSQTDVFCYLRSESNIFSFFLISYSILIGLGDLTLVMEVTGDG